MKPNNEFAMSSLLKISSYCLSCFLIACGGASQSDNNVAQNPVEPPDGAILLASFRDTDSDKGAIGGELTFSLSTENIDISAGNTSLRIYWAYEGERSEEFWFELDELDLDVLGMAKVMLPNATQLPAGVNELKLYLNNQSGESSEGVVVRFHDFFGNALLSGPGGNEDSSWYYGQTRPKIPIYQASSESSICIFDNGLVSVVDMENQRDELLHTGSNKGQANQADDLLFAPFTFQCDPSPINESHEISDEHGVWTYSTLNDSMFYGTIAYDAFLKHLGEPPLEDKIRLRVHYGSLSSQYAFWDGAYANFSDAYPFYYSMASLDAIAHEVAHGVLNRISGLNIYETELSTDAKTVHEAFSDISGLMVKLEFYGHSDSWVHDEGIYGYSRHLDKIVTEQGAIESFLDYTDAGDNFYLRIGMMTYPFYLLSGEWGMAQAYQVYIRAARDCWFADMSLFDAAHCIKLAASSKGFEEADVIEAFKTVKIKLFDEGVLSHFNYQFNASDVEFIDNSQSTSEVMEWHWTFGDGADSNLSNPTHRYQSPGEYVVSLTVVDSSNHQDSFEKKLVISE